VSFVEVTAPALIRTTNGSTVSADQYRRSARIVEARLAASNAMSERILDVLVLESAKACIFAMPSRPTDITMSATMTSIRLNPEPRRRP